DLLADRFDCLLTIGGHRPVTGEARDLVNEIRQELRAIRCVHHFRVELNGVESALLVSNCRIWRAGRRADHAEAFGDRSNAIAMAHPHLVARALGPDPLEQRAVFLNLQEGTAELAVISGLDLAA